MIKVVGSVDTEMALDEATAYSKGYIQALEDSLRDIQDYVHRSKYAVRIETLITENLGQARESLKQLEEIQYGK